MKHYSSKIKALSNSLRISNPDDLTIFDINERMKEKHDRTPIQDHTW